MTDDPYSHYGAWVIQCITIRVMVIPLVRGAHRPGPQYVAASIREAKCTRLGYMTRLSRLHTTDPLPLLSISHSKGQPFSSTEP
jgi:hypothetical protein